MRRIRPSYRSLYAGTIAIASFVVTIGVAPVSRASNDTAQFARAGAVPLPPTDEFTDRYQNPDGKWANGSREGGIKNLAISGSIMLF